MNNTLQLKNALIAGFITVFAILLFQSCDTETELNYEGDTYSYGNFKMYIVFKADTAKSYRATLNDEAISFGSNEKITRSKLTGTLKIYNGSDTVPELSENVTIIPGSTLNLIQLTGENIKFYTSYTESTEPAPATRNCVKVRFYYTGTDIATFDDSIRMVVQAKINLASATTYTTVDTIYIKRGALSEYVNLDMAKYWASNQAGTSYTYNLYDLSNPNSPTLILRRSSLISSTTDQTDENGPIVDYKFMTFNLYKTSVQEISALCETWD